MNTWIRATVASFALLTATGCAPRTVTAVATVELSEASAAEKQAAAAILEARCRSLVGRYTAPSVSSTIVPAGVRLEFQGEAPADDTIRRYASTHGVMRITSEQSRLISIVTDRDVESVAASMGDAGAMLELMLTESAGQRMLEYTKQHQGEILLTSWDGAEPTAARISGVFGRQFQTTGMDRETAMLRTVVLRSGRLPTLVKSVVVDHPTR